MSQHGPTLPLLLLLLLAFACAVAAEPPREILVTTAVHIAPATPGDKLNGVGTTLALSGMLAVAGAPYYAPGLAMGAPVGAVVVLKCNTTCNAVQTLQPSGLSAVTYGLFGAAVAVDGTLVAVGAPGGGSSGQGWVALYECAGVLAGSATPCVARPQVASVSGTYGLHFGSAVAFATAHTTGPTHSRQLAVLCRSPDVMTAPGVVGYVFNCAGLTSSTPCAVGTALVDTAATSGFSPGAQALAFSGALVFATVTSTPAVDVWDVSTCAFDAGHGFNVCTTPSARLAPIAMLSTARFGTALAVRNGILVASAPFYAPPSMGQIGAVAVIRGCFNATSCAAAATTPQLIIGNRNTASFGYAVDVRIDDDAAVNVTVAVGDPATYARLGSVYQYLCTDGIGCSLEGSAHATEQSTYLGAAIVLSEDNEAPFGLVGFTQSNVAAGGVDMFYGPVLGPTVYSIPFLDMFTSAFYQGALTIDGTPPSSKDCRIILPAPSTSASSSPWQLLVGYEVLGYDNGQYACCMRRGFVDGTQESVCTTIGCVGVISNSTDYFVGVPSDPLCLGSSTCYALGNNYNATLEDVPVFTGPEITTFGSARRRSSAPIMPYTSVSDTQVVFIQPSDKPLASAWSIVVDGLAYACSAQGEYTGGTTPTCQRPLPCARPGYEVLTVYAYDADPSAVNPHCYGYCVAAGQ